MITVAIQRIVRGGLYTEPILISKAPTSRHVLQPDRNPPSLCAIIGLACAKWDKQMAHRGARLKQNLYLKTCLDYKNLLQPHPL